MLPRKVDVLGESYECARNYMIRIEPGDLSDPEKLKAMAKAAKMSDAAFRERFAHTV
jgi:hypothetical protein